MAEAVTDTFSQSRLQYSLCGQAPIAGHLALSQGPPLPPVWRATQPPDLGSFHVYPNELDWQRVRRSFRHRFSLNDIGAMGITPQDALYLLCWDCKHFRNEDLINCADFGMTLSYV